MQPERLQTRMSQQELQTNIKPRDPQGLQPCAKWGGARRSHLGHLKLQQPMESCCLPWQLCNKAASAPPVVQPQQTAINPSPVINMATQKAEEQAETERWTASALVECVALVLAGGAHGGEAHIAELPLAKRVHNQW